jgi:hypothetical protein
VSVADLLVRKVCLSTISRHPHGWVRCSLQADADGRLRAQQSGRRQQLLARLRRGLRDPEAAERVDQSQQASALHVWHRAEIRDDHRVRADIGRAVGPEPVRVPGLLDGTDHGVADRAQRLATLACHPLVVTERALGRQGLREVPVQHLLPTN